MNTLSRRVFLKQLAAFGGGFALRDLLRPSLLLAQTASASSGKNFIIINQLGGCDGSAAYPLYQGPAADLMRTRLRPTLFANPNTVIPIGNQAGLANKIGLHRAFQPLASVANSNMKIIQKYGNPLDVGRSHDTCQILASLGRTQLPGGDMQGVLARLMDQQNWESFQYWALGSPPTVDINTKRSIPIVLGDLESFNYNRTYAEDDLELDFAVQTERQLLEIQNPKSAQESLYKSSLQAMHRVVSVLRNDIALQSVGKNVSGDYTTEGIGPNLRDAAKILKAKATSTPFGQANKDSILYLTHDGYDTHSNELNPEEGLQSLLENLAQNLAVLVSDLKGMGVWNNTVILLISEFGRTNHENGSVGTAAVGTDHGWGNNTLVLGGTVQAGVIGDAPLAAELLDEDTNALVPVVDFRHIWGDVIAWLGVSPSSILDETGYTYSPLGIFS